MKKAFCMIALAAICLGTVSASVSLKPVSDTTKVKTKMKHGNLKQKSKSPNKKSKNKNQGHYKTLVFIKTNTSARVDVLVYG